MRRKRGILFALLCAATMAGLLGCQSVGKTGGRFTPGVYQGVGEGHNGPIKVAVKVDAEKILSIEIEEQSETPGISNPAFEKLPSQIIEQDTVALDVVAGASDSSKGILAAVKTALLAAGASEADITKPAVKTAAPSATIQQTADVIVIGTGGAGMTAAAEITRAGGSVIVIDKMASLGGNTIVAGSAMNAADPEVQRQQTMPASQLETIRGLLALKPHDAYMARWQAEVKKDSDAYTAAKSTYLYDSPALHKLQTYVGGDYVANPKLVEILCDNALGSVRYLTDLGAQWLKGTFAAVGATWPRSHQPDALANSGGKGAAFVLPQTNFVKAHGGRILLEYKATELIRENGRVVGVKGTTGAGSPFELRGTKGVVLATGGFSANVEMRQKYNKYWPTLDASVPTTNPVSSTGDGIVMAEAIGANLVGMEWIQLVTGSAKGSFTASISNNIYVNQDGKRFVREDARRDVLSGAVLAQKGSMFWLLTDAHTTVDMLHGIAYDGTPIDKLVDGKGLFKADTIEDLARKIGADPAVLKATVDQYNEAALKGNDPLGRQLFDKPFDKPPYYAGWGCASVHHTMGGVQINEKAQVLDTSGHVIPGLYAAGEVTGGIHGSNRLGGNAIADIVTFGRIAGQNIMRE